MAATLRELKKDQVKKEDIAAIVNQAIVSQVTKRFDLLDKKTDSIEERVTKLEKQRGAAAAPKARQAGSNSAEFIAARRSLQISPCQPSPAAVEEFLRKEMKIPQDIINTVSIKRFEQIFPRNLPAHRQASAKRKVLIELKSIDQRDLIMSFASNLKDGAGIDIVIPDHLKVTARKLEHRAFRLRQMSKVNAAGDKDKILKTQVRFDSVKEGLALGIRSSKDAAWEFFPPGKLPPAGQAYDDTSSDDDMPTV